MACTATPVRSSVATHSAAVAPVVTTSSTSTTDVPTAGSPPRRANTRPARLACRPATPNPTESRTPHAIRNPGATAAATPARASIPAARRTITSTCCPPRRRAALALDGTGTNHIPSP
jgi:hypothetical protein